MGHARDGPHIDTPIECTQMSWICCPIGDIVCESQMNQFTQMSINSPGSYNIDYSISNFIRHSNPNNSYESHISVGHIVLKVEEVSLSDCGFKEVNSM